VSDPMTAPTGSPMSAAREREIRDALAHGFWPPTGVIAVVEELLWELDRLREDAARLDAMDALENARLILRTEAGGDEVLWWRMPTHLRAANYTNSLDRPIRAAIDRARSTPGGET
jgi:hypothetical protein